MKTKITSAFMNRQVMESKQFELFYFEDSYLAPVHPHRHDNYELYFYLEGNTDYIINNNKYSLQTGDFVIVPPGLLHAPIFNDFDTPYRRFVLWIHPTLVNRLVNNWAELSYSFTNCLEAKQYLFHCTPLIFQEFQGKLIQIIKTNKSCHFAHYAESELLLASFLIKISQLVHSSKQNNNTPTEPNLFITLCNYIDQHLDDDLSLDTLAAHFFISKYYISHIFKHTIGISPHQYIIKKRLEASQSAILSGDTISKLFYQFGFKDYTSFFRAFKKEYGISPSEFQSKNQLHLH